MKPRVLGVVLFPGFELLDVFGPLEMFGKVESIHIVTIAETAGAVASAQGPAAVASFTLTDAPKLDLLLVPGGQGTRREVDNAAIAAFLVERAASAELVLSVCTGAALLARAGLLDGHRATTNKLAFDWVVSQGPNVQWVRQARWVEDGRWITSSGISAGIDMSLAVIARLYGLPEAERIERRAEYQWQRDPTVDPFAV